MYQDSVLSVLIDITIFAINIASIIIAILADVSDSLKYESIYVLPNVISILDLIFFSIYVVVFAAKIATCNSQTLQELKMERQFVNKLPFPFKKIIAFLMMPLQLLELFILLVFGMLFWPFSFVIRNFKVFFYISFYMRCLKMVTYFRGGRIFLKILYRGRRRLLELVFMFVILALMLGCSAFLAEMYTNTQKTPIPEFAFENLTDGIWWAIVTITTTGYGDYALFTPVGRFIGSITMLIGILYITMPISIISSVFESYVVEEEKRREKWRAAILERVDSYAGKSTIGPKKSVDHNPRTLENILRGDSEDQLGVNRTDNIDSDENLPFRFNRQILLQIEKLIERQQEMLKESMQLKTFIQKQQNKKKRKSRMDILSRVSV
ncbi:hypothetical protein MHBO_000166 [Bonamia ostreae]|uniref:Ion transport domain-containing protein n=1 Tax=Bonamia ostreae TaxID=126728 RepID=A0ABV2AEM0_9EUKA